jgi:drug/metabolite transporter (DMT)-like permease
MGAAEAPTKFVTAGITPFLISLGMVGGVFVARWTLPTVLKGTTYVFHDLREKPHLIVWGLLAGALWAVANSLSVFAVRDVGLAIAFPLWNTDSLVGLLWGWLFFRELRGAGSAVKVKVLGGSITIILGAILLGYASSLHSGYEARRSAAGIISSLGASVIWGTMFLPYRKAYISGMNPLSFVTIFTIGELITMGSLALAFHGGMEPLMRDMFAARKAFFWLFLGGFCWVVGDLFANYAAKYVGIGRAAPLMNTNQLWGLAWGGSSPTRGDCNGTNSDNIGPHREVNRSMITGQQIRAARAALRTGQRQVGRLSKDAMVAQPPGDESSGSGLRGPLVGLATAIKLAA